MKRVYANACCSHTKILRRCLNILWRHIHQNVILIDHCFYTSVVDPKVTLTLFFSLQICPLQRLKYSALQVHASVENQWELCFSSFIKNSEEMHLFWRRFKYHNNEFARKYDFTNHGGVKIISIYSGILRAYIRPHQLWSIPSVLMKRLVLYYSPNESLPEPESDLSGETHCWQKDWNALQVLWKKKWLPIPISWSVPQFVSYR